MPLKVAVQMDPSRPINRRRYDLRAVAGGAAARPHALPLHARRLSGLGDKVLPASRNDGARQEGRPLLARRAVPHDLQEIDVVLLRQDPPFDMNYITTTHILERIHPKTLVVNDPPWVRNSPEKIFVTEFPELMPPTLITKDPREVDAFRKEHGDIIVKPLYGNGGAGVFRLQRPTATSLRCSSCSGRCSASPSSCSATSGGAQGRQAHHPDRRRTCRRDQPRAGRTRIPLQHACRRPCGADRADRARARDLRRIGP